MFISTQSTQALLTAWTQKYFGQNLLEMVLWPLAARKMDAPIDWL